MSTTNGQRIGHLRRGVSDLAATIERRGLQEEYLSYLSRVSRGEQGFVEIADGEWELLLPEERERNLLPYHHRLRTELFELQREARTKDAQNENSSWLDEVWVQRTLTAVALAQAAEFIVKLAHSTGLFLHSSGDDVQAGTSDGYS